VLETVTAFSCLTTVRAKCHSVRIELRLATMLFRFLHMNRFLMTFADQ